MIGYLWASRANTLATQTPQPVTTQCGYRVYCETCGGDIIEYQTAHALHGVGEGGTFRNTYHHDPHTCP